MIWFGRSPFVVVKWNVIQSLEVTLLMLVGKSNKDVMNGTETVQEIHLGRKKKMKVTRQVAPS